MIAQFLDYLKQLCVAHVDFQNADDNRAYFEFDYQAMTTAKKRNKYVLYVDKLNGKLGDNRGDYQTDKAYVTALFLVKMSTTNLTLARQHFLACKAHMDQFLKKMEFDRQNSESIDICRMLRHLNFDEITWESAPITNDLWTGVQMRVPFVAAVTEEYDAEKWIAPPKSLPAGPEK